MAWHLLSPWGLWSISGETLQMLLRFISLLAPKGLETRIGADLMLDLLQKPSNMDLSRDENLVFRI